MKIGKAKAVMTVIIPTLLLTGCSDRADINIMDYSHKDPVPLEWDNDAGNFRSQIKDLLVKLGIDVYDNTNVQQGDTVHEQTLYGHLSRVEYIEDTVDKSSLDYFKKQEYDNLMKNKDSAMIALADKNEELIIMYGKILDNLLKSWDDFFEYDFTPTLGRTEEQERQVLKSDIQTLITQAKNLINANSNNDYFSELKKENLEKRISMCEDLINDSNYNNTDISSITMSKAILENLIKSW